LNPNNYAILTKLRYQMALDMDIETEKWKYPALAKQDSDGIFCYHIQRRISGWFSVRLANKMSANAATGVDMFFGLAAAVLIVLDQWLWGVLLVQMFGIFSCVDGELARIQGQSSKIGDYLDTLTDRFTELLLIAAITVSLTTHVLAIDVMAAGFALLGGVFMLTTSSEKFRSSYHIGYPKRRLERFFCLFSAGSDNRLLMLSLGLVVSALTGNAQLLVWLMWAMAALVYLNFFTRILLIYRHYGTEDDIQS
jgi:phosphatidylglycerophosphate synthase